MSAVFYRTKCGLPFLRLTFDIALLKNAVYNYNLSRYLALGYISSNHQTKTTAQLSEDSLITHIVCPATDLKLHYLLRHTTLRWRCRIINDLAIKEVDVRRAPHHRHRADEAR